MASITASTPVSSTRNLDDFDPFAPLPSVEPSTIIFNPFETISEPQQPATASSVNHTFDLIDLEGGEDTNRAFKSSFFSSSDIARAVPPWADVEKSEDEESELSSNFVDPRLAVVYGGLAVGERRGYSNEHVSPSLLQQRHVSKQRNDHTRVEGTTTSTQNETRSIGGDAASNSCPGHLNSKYPASIEVDRESINVKVDDTVREQPRAFSCFVRASTRSIVTKDWKSSTFLLYQVGHCCDNFACGTLL
jgi:hypothetical protein